LRRNGHRRATRDDDADRRHHYFRVPVYPYVLPFHFRPFQRSELFLIR
jgi:hypothetical protein